MLKVFLHILVCRTINVYLANTKNYRAQEGTQNCFPLIFLSRYRKVVSHYHKLENHSHKLASHYHKIVNCSHKLESRYHKILTRSHKLAKSLPQDTNSFPQLSKVVTTRYSFIPTS